MGTRHTVLFISIKNCFTCKLFNGWRINRCLWRIEQKVYKFQTLNTVNFQTPKHKTDSSRINQVLKQAKWKPLFFFLLVNQKEKYTTWSCFEFVRFFSLPLVHASIINPLYCFYVQICVWIEYSKPYMIPNTDKKMTILLWSSSTNVECTNIYSTLFKAQNKKQVKIIIAKNTYKFSQNNKLCIQIEGNFCAEFLCKFYTQSE